MTDTHAAVDCPSDEKVGGSFAATAIQRRRMLSIRNVLLFAAASVAVMPVISTAEHDAVVAMTIGNDNRPISSRSRSGRSRGEDEVSSAKEVMVASSPVSIILRRVEQDQERQRQRRGLFDVEEEEELFADGSNEATISSDNSSSLETEEEDSYSSKMDSFYESEYDSDPFESTRDEVGINMTEMLAMKLTDAPTASPRPSSPSIPTTPSWSDLLGDGGEAYFDNDNDDPVPPGGGYYGGLFGGGSSSKDGGGGGYHNNPRSSEETDFHEFLAFVGWYAFLIVCCLLPTACAYYRRRRNVRALRENLVGIQARLAEIERRRDEDAGGGGLQVNLSGENRDQEWEFLEQLFRSSPRDDNANNADANTESQVRIMSDILGHAGLTSRLLDYMEREHRRKRERGRKLVAALKETSMCVEEEHLIAKKAKGLNQANVMDVVEDGDIELGNMDNTNCDKNDGDESGDISEERKESDSKSNENEKSEADNARGSNDEQIEENKTTAITPTNNFRITSSPNSAEDVAQSVMVAAVASTTQPHPQDANNPPSSLYAVDDPYMDSDDEDNQYSALRIQARQPNSSSANSETSCRTVSATCAICLVQYTPGCYVSWSSNGQCTHAFHRDCILMWLLKKEGTLCPCCRQEFVPEAALQGVGDESGERDEDGGGGGAGDEEDGRRDAAAVRGGEASATVTLDGAIARAETPRPQATPATTSPSSSARYSNLPGSFSIGWGNDSGSTDGGVASSRPRTPSSRMNNSFSIG